MNKKGKKILLLLGVLISVLLVIGVSYAVWRLYLSQTNTSKLLSACFKVTLEDQDEINLENAYPITDGEGSSLTPYKFTITNKCEGQVNYQINLEILNTTTLEKLEYIKLSLDDEINTLGNYETSKTTLIDAQKAYKIKTGTLGAKESKTYNLRIWLAANTPATEEFMEKIFDSKITVYASYEKEITEVENLANTIVTLSKNDKSNLIIDDYGNTRYIGANPDNYVLIDGELWRIIGVMKSIDDGTGTKSDRVKLIRNDSIGNFAWDTSASSINTGYGINEWSQADLMKLLNPGYNNNSINNSLYYNVAKGSCYNESNNKAASCDLSTSGMKRELKSLIDSAVWNIGSNGTSTTYNLINTQKFYELERSTNTGKICSSGTFCNDTTSRKTTWIGLVGLMYPSDYGYATSGGETGRESCLGFYLSKLNSYPECYQNNWLYQTEAMYTITPMAYASEARYAFTVKNNVGLSFTSTSNAIKPTVYLKPEVRVISGSGNINDPFIIRA